MIVTSQSSSSGDKRNQPHFVGCVEQCHYLSFILSTKDLLSKPGGNKQTVIEAQHPCHYSTAQHLDLIFSRLPVIGGEIHSSLSIPDTATLSGKNSMNSNQDRHDAGLCQMGVISGAIYIWLSKRHVPLVTTWNTGLCCSKQRLPPETVNTLVGINAACL